MLAFAMIIAIFFDFSEASTAESVKFQAQIFAFFILHCVDVRFFANANLRAERVDRATHGERFEREVIVAEIGETIAVNWNVWRKNIRKV